LAFPNDALSVRRPAELAVPTTKAAARPQTAPITAPRMTPPVNHITPRLTSKDTTTKTTRDKINALGF
jgi:hypothetical protein